MQPQQDRPASLLVGAVLVGLQGIGLVVFGAVELLSLDADRLALALTTALFFVVVGAGLVWCARALLDRQSWARGPVVALQLIGVLTGFSFWGGETTSIAIGVLAANVLTLGAVLHPATTAALASEEFDGTDGTGRP